MMKQGYGKILYTDSHKSFYKTLIIRLMIVAAIILFTSVIMYFHRGELKHSFDHDLNYMDILYFTIISVSTVGYGDIVPGSSWTRLFDAFFITFVRFSTWFVIMTTALQLMVPKILEGFMIKRLIERTKNHTIICGFGRIGREILDKMLSNKENPEQIVVVDTDEEKTQWAAEKGVSALRGDAENEEILRMADVANAKKVFICADEDHTNLMICLTARTISEKVEIITVARENENVKIFQRAGATNVISLPELLSREMLRQDKEGSVVK